MKTYRETINEKLSYLMKKDPKIVLIGEDIGCFGGCFGVTKGLFEKFGPKRVIDSPMSEQSLVGLGIGAAIGGLKPIIEIMFMDFITLAYDQLFNHASIFNYLTNNEVPVPLILRVSSGGGKGYGATHSKTLIAPLMHIPGIKILAPSNIYDAGFLLEEALKDNNPVVFVEHKLLYEQTQELTDKTIKENSGKANILRDGKDIVIISYSKTVIDCLQAAAILEKEGISCKVIDLRYIKPLDLSTIKEAVNQIGKVLIVEEGYGMCGVAAEIITQINENCFYSLEAAPRRLTALDVPYSCCKEFESIIIPSVSKIVNNIKEILNE